VHKGLLPAAFVKGGANRLIFKLKPPPPLATVWSFFMDFQHPSQCIADAQTIAREVRFFDALIVPCCHKICSLLPFTLMDPHVIPAVVPKLGPPRQSTLVHGSS
jgi:hypothetical protein